MSVQNVTRVAVVQAGSAVFDAVKCVEKLSKLAKEAATGGAKLVLFPEAFISGYPHCLSLGRPGQPEPKERFTYQRYFDSSVEVPGPIVTQLENIAKQNHIYMVVGVIEKELNTMYCTVLFFNDDGEYLGKHRKLIPTAAERIIWGPGDGSTLPVFDLAIGKLGAVICWENYMPLLRTAMYSKGIQIYCAPNADQSDRWTSTMRHIAAEGRCYVLSCNQYVKKSDYPVDMANSILCDTDVVCNGGSCIISPLGQILAGPNFSGEGILYADLDMAEVTRGKFDMDCVGHYSRPDIFTLYVNEKKNSNVIIGNASQPSCQMKKVDSLKDESVQCNVKNLSSGK